MQSDQRPIKYILCTGAVCSQTFWQNSGIDFCWTETDVYGSATVRQLLDGKHVRRCIDAHIITRQKLHSLYQAAFFEQHSDVLDRLTVTAEILEDACHGSGDVHQAQEKMMQEMQSLMCQFDKQNSGKPLFVVMRQYLQMITEVLQYVRAVRTGNWHLHLQSTETFIKYFFAHHVLNYARMMPVYLSDMEKLTDSEATIYAEFLQGNWIVNKSSLPFCAIEADHPLEHINCAMKVSEG